MTDISSIQAYVPDISLGTILPYIILLLGGVACLFADAASEKEGSRKVLPLISGASVLLALVYFFFFDLPTVPFAEETFIGSEFGQLGSMVILISALVMIIMSPKLLERRNMPSGEYYTLICFGTAGMVLLATANELLTAFIALEILSLSLYVLTSLDRRSPRATEAGFKYFILGSFASAFLVFGIAFLFGATHTTFLHEMAAVFQAGVVGPNEDAVNPLWVFMGFALLFVGICFKLSLAPFHMWAPDVYQGATTPTTMMIATGSKVAAVALLVNVVEALSYYPDFANGAVFIVGFVAVVSMIWGNLAALVQTDIKRMLAYSSVAHTGYVTVGAVVLLALPSLPAAMLQGQTLEGAQDAVRNAMVFYMAGYTLMNVLAFGIAQYVGGEGDMGAYRGLVHRKPVAALGMAVAMFSLLGIPPTVGFMGKFYVFKEAVQYDFVGLAVIGVLASVASAFYYLSLVVTMFMREEEAGEPVAGAPAAAGVTGGLATAMPTVPLMAVLVASAALVMIFGVLPTLFFALNF